MARETVYPFILRDLFRHVASGMRILEIGCGGGLYRPFIQAAGCMYYGTDLPNEHYQDKGSVDLYSSADALPFRDCSFDLVFKQGAVDYMPGPGDSLREMFRVLKPGGMLLIYTYDRATLEAIHVNVLQSQRTWELTHHVFSGDELLASLHTCGFKARETTRELFSLPPRHIITVPLINSAILGLRLTTESNGIWTAFSCRRPQPVSLRTRIRSFVYARIASLKQKVITVYESTAICKDRILSAVSSDGLSWRREPGIRVDVRQNDDMAYGCSLVTAVSPHRLFYQAGALSGGLWHTQILQKNMPGAETADWKTTGIERGAHPLCANRVQSPHVIFLEPFWRMYFAGTDANGITRILMAFSPDLEQWTIHELPMLEPAMFTRTDGRAVTALVDPTLLALPGGGWRMYVSAELGAHHVQEIMSASSVDGLNWLPEAGVRIQNGTPGMLEVVNNPSVLRRNDEIWMWFRGSDHMPLDSNIFVAQSKDGLTFSGIRKVLAYSKWRPYERHGIGFPYVIATGEGFRMYYTGYWGNWNCGKTVAYYRKRKGL